MKKLDLVTLIAPRLEFYYLEEWINHYLSLGFDNIYIYNNGFNLCLTDTEKSKNKRYGDYSFQEFTEEQINNSIDKISASYDKVEIIPWEYGTDHMHKYPRSQFRSIMNYCEFSDADFMCFLDLDEFMICKTKIKDFLSDKNFDSCKIYQYEQQTRKRRKIKNIPIIKENYTKKFGKNISRVDSLKSLIKKQGKLKGWSHHFGFRSEDFKNIIETQEIYYNHYMLED
jgi:hypothetical protein